MLIKVNAKDNNFKDGLFINPDEISYLKKLESDDGKNFM